jgi:hypothetical protein
MICHAQFDVDQAAQNVTVRTVGELPAVTLPDRFNALALAAFR